MIATMRNGLSPLNYLGGNECLIVDFAGEVSFILYRNMCGRFSFDREKRSGCDKSEAGPRTKATIIFRFLMKAMPLQVLH